MYFLLVLIVLLVALDYGLRRREETTAHSVLLRTAKNRLALVVGAVVFVLVFVLDGLFTGAWGTSLLLAVLVSLVITLLVGVSTGRPEPLGDAIRRRRGRTPR